MFIRKKNLKFLNSTLFELQNTVFDLQNTTDKLTNKINALEKQVKQIDTKIQKRYISEKTTEKDEVPISQIMDEWLNGEEEGVNAK